MLLGYHLRTLLLLSLPPRSYTRPARSSCLLSIPRRKNCHPSICICLFRTSCRQRILLRNNRRCWICKLPSRAFCYFSTPQCTSPLFTFLGSPSLICGHQPTGQSTYHHYNKDKILHHCASHFSNSLRIYLHSSISSFLCHFYRPNSNRHCTSHQG